jgi:hypothetical protein
VIAFYWPECWAFRVYPINDVAKENFKHGELITELDYVSRLYRMRRQKLMGSIIDILHDELPQGIAA